MLSDPKHLVANEAQILMYRRRSQHHGKNVTLGPVQRQICPTDCQGPQITRTRVVFGEDGNVVRTVREPTGVDARSLR